MTTMALHVRPCSFSAFRSASVLFSGVQAQPLDSSG